MKLNWQLISVGCNLIGTIILVFFPYAAKTYGDDGEEVVHLIAEGNGRKLTQRMLFLSKSAPRLGFVLLMFGSGIQFLSLL